MNDVLCIFTRYYADYEGKNNTNFSIEWLHKNILYMKQNNNTCFQHWKKVLRLPCCLLHSHFPWQLTTAKFSMFCSL